MAGRHSGRPAAACHAPGRAEQSPKRLQAEAAEVCKGQHHVQCTHLHSPDAEDLLGCCLPSWGQHAKCLQGNGQPVDNLYMFVHATP